MTTNEGNHMKLGDRVRDNLTGFEGTVTGIVDYITGCRQALITPEMKADASEYPKSSWVDEDRLSVVQADAYPHVVTTAGFGDAAPTK